MKRQSLHHIRPPVRSREQLQLTSTAQFKGAGDVVGSEWRAEPVEYLAANLLAAINRTLSDEATDFLYYGTTGIEFWHQTHRKTLNDRHGIV